MAYEPRRTLLIGLSALAVVLAAALFPAAGVGSHPGGSIGIGVPGESAPDTPTPEPRHTPTPAPTEGSSVEATDSPTPTATETEAPAGSNQGSDGDVWPDLSLAALAGLLAKLFGWGLVASLIVALALVVRGAQPGTPRVELPFGLTVTLPFTIPEWMGTFTTGLSRLTMGFVVSISASVTQLLDALGAAGRGVASGLAIVTGEGLRGVARLLASIPAGLAGALASLATLPAALASIPSAFSTVGRSLGGSSDRPDEDVRETAPDPERIDEAAEDAGPPGVEDAWLAMTDLLPVDRDASTTPAEFARAAVERGVPAGPVRRLTRAFEDVAYGGRAPDERATTAREALARLRDRLGGNT